MQVVFGVWPRFLEINDQRSTIYVRLGDWEFQMVLKTLPGFYIGTGQPKRCEVRGAEVRVLLVVHVPLSGTVECVG